MEKSIFISLPLEELQSVIIDCVNSCLRQNGNEKIEQHNELLNIDQVSEILGLSKPTLYLMCRQGRIPFSKPTGKRIYFSRDEVLEWATAKQKKEELSFITRNRKVN